MGEDYPMSLLNAIESILREEKQPLHVSEICRKVIDTGLWETNGKTPEATVGARLYVDIKEKGEQSLFIQFSPSTFALRKTPEVIPSSINSSLSFMDCAQKVLEEYSPKKQMHYREITEKALVNGWLVTNGKTPAASMYAQIITEIKRQQKRGEHPRFIQHGRGYVSLSSWKDQRDLYFEIEQHNEKVREALLKNLLAMSPGEFEELASQLLAEMGLEMVDVTKLSGDGGIDVRGTLVVGEVIRIKMAVQVKKWKPKNNVQAPTVQQIRGALSAHEQGLIITTSDFSSGAIKEASQSDKTPIALMNGEQLCKLLMEYGIGVRRSSQDLFEIDKNFVQ